jgi:hypothetical protein
VAISFFALQGFIFLVTQYFQFIKGFSPLGAGVRLLPVATAVAVASVAGTRLAVRVGNKAVVTAGLLSFAVGLLWTATVSASTSYTIIVGQMLFLGAGMGMTSAPATEAIMGAVPKAKAGVGSAVNDATRLFGGTLGVAVIGSVAASLYSNRLASTAPDHLPAQATSAARASIGGAILASQALNRAGLTHTANALATSASGAFLHSLTGGCAVAGGVVAVGAIMTALFLPARPGREPETEPPSGGGALSPGVDPLEPALQSAACPTPERPLNATSLRSAITVAEHERTENERSAQ